MVNHNPDVLGTKAVTAFRSRSVSSAYPYVLVDAPGFLDSGADEVPLLDKIIDLTLKNVGRISSILFVVHRHHFLPIGSVGFPSSMKRLRGLQYIMLSDVRKLPHAALKIVVTHCDTDIGSHRVLARMNESERKQKEEDFGWSCAERNSREFPRSETISDVV